MTKELNTQDLTADEMTALANSLQDRATEKRKAERKAELDAQRAKEAAENRDHYNRMFTELGEPLAGLNAEQHATVYAKAWEQGHSSGYSEVENYYGELAEMARQIIADA